MSLESLLPSFGDLGSASLLVLAVGVTLFFFGKLIADTKPKPTEKEDYYIDGLFFSIMYIAIPFFIMLMLVNFFNISTPFPIWLSILVQLVILVFLDFVLLFRIRQVEWKKYRKIIHETVEKTFKHQTEQGQKTSSPIIADAYANVQKSGNFIVNLYDSVYGIPEKAAKYCKGKTLFAFSFLLLWTIYSTYYLQNLLAPLSILIWIISFLNFSFLAVAYGYLNNKYPQAKIVLNDGTEFTGKIRKFGKFVSFIKTGDEKLMTINAEQILYIEEDLFKSTAVTRADTQQT